MNTSFESRVWQRAVDRGLLTPTQVTDCLKESDSDAPTLQLTEFLIAQGLLDPALVTKIRGELALAEPDAPDEVRAAAKDPHKLIGRYVVVGELGRGGMGVVYKAWDGDLRRYVALKMLSGPWDDEDLARFRREAQSAAGLNHPNIIKVFEISPSDESPFIALEYVEGRTLHGRKLLPRKAAELMIVVARAVEAAHRRGIIHRDLKPSNVMLDDKGSPRIMDFGLARPVASSSQITMSGMVMGTPAYMSPEQAQGRNKDVDQRSDLFSLGATLYELLTGQVPFTGKTPLQTLTAVVKCDPVRPRKLSPSIPQALEAVLLTCLQKDPARRYPSCEALAQDLERFLRGEKVTARIPVPRGLFVAAGSGALAFATALLFLLWPSEPAAAPAPPPKPRPVAPKPVDRAELDRGLHLMEEARLDLYRAGIPLSTIVDKLLEAERCFDAALKADPESGAAFLARGDVRSRLSRYNAALPDYAEAARRLPTSPAVYLSRGRMLLERYLRERNSAPKEEMTEECRRWCEDARADFIKARDLTPAQNDLPSLQAWMALSNDDYEEAIRLATKAIPSAERPEEFYQIRGDAGMLLAEVGQKMADRPRLWQTCVADFSEVIRLRANSPDAYRQRGAASWLLGRSDDARKDFQTVLDRDPQDSRALSDMGTWCLRTGKIPQAMDHFNRAVAANPQNLRAWANRAAIHMHEDRLAEARKDLEQALRVNPSYLAAQFNLAVTLRLLGERTEALRWIDEALRRSPQFGRGRLLRGLLHAEGSRWKEALDDLERGLELAPAEASSEVRAALDRCRRELRR